MVSYLFYYQLVLIALLWLCVMLLCLFAPRAVVPPWRRLAARRLGARPRPPATVYPMPPAPQAHGPSAIVSPPPWRALPPSRLATPVPTPLPRVHRPPHPRPR